MTDEEKDVEFLNKYLSLCKEYNRCIDIVGVDTVGVVREENTSYSFSMPEERETEHRIHKQKHEEDLKYVEDQYKIYKDEYIKNGGALDIHGEVPPPFPKNYCQMTPVSFSADNLTLSSGPILRWGKAAEDFNKISKTVLDVVKSGSYKSQEIQDILLKQGFYSSDTKDVITELWELGLINFGDDFRIKMVDNPERDG
jgi:hypothetical protein